MNRLSWVPVVLCLAAPTTFAQPASPTSAAKAPLPEHAGSAPPPASTAPVPDRSVSIPNDPPPPPGRVWAEGELLLGFLRGEMLPPLVTTSPVGTARSAAGILGQPGTAVLFGNQRVNEDLVPGFRARLGAWCDCDRLYGVEGSFFFLGNDSTTFRADSSQFPILARPIFNARTNASDSQVLALPGALAGSISIEAERGTFYGFDLNGRRALCCGCNYRFDLLGGYRFLRLTDELTIQESITTTNPTSPLPFGTTINLRERFRTENTFNGGQIGAVGEYRWGGLVAGFRGLVALGNLHRTVIIDGSSVVNVPGQSPVTTANGLLAQPTNTGRFSTDQFAVATDVGLSLGYQLTDRWLVSVGYSVIYLSNVLRPGDQIDLAVNVSQLRPGVFTGPARPALAPRSTEFWAQAITFGLSARY